MSLSISKLLSAIPDALRDALIKALNEIESNFKESRWEPSELNGGKLCEVAYTIIKGFMDGGYPSAPSKPKNMVESCKNLENSPSTYPRSIRIQIPRMIAALYEIRNNRGVGHVGGDVDPNHMDAACVLQMSKWIVAELIRVFHNVSTKDATAAVDALSNRDLPLIWQVNGISRVLNNSLSMLDKTLAILYGDPAGLAEEYLVASVEHSNISVYRRDILRKAHKKRLLEYNATTKVAMISPLGIQYVETKILA